VIPLADAVPAAVTSSEAAPAVRVEQLSKIYRLYSQPQDRLKEMLLGRLGRRFSRDFWALRDVSFELARGQRLGVIGRNGSGKSTLLQILAGTLAPTAGEVEVRGRVGALLELGSGFNPEYTGRENIYVNASILGLTREQTDERFDAIAAFADIGEFLDQPVKTYSSGMFVRLAFAVTASVDAEVLLIDEALAVGDVFFTQKCYRRLHDLVDRGVAVVFVSHDASAVGQFCSSVLVLEHGRVEFLGDPVAGIRTYFNLQRGGPSVPAVEATRSAVGSRVERQVESQIIEWPAPDAFSPIEDMTYIGSGARCTALALCDRQLEPKTQFEMGDTALFFFEFTLDRDIEAPIGGLEIFNERHIVVHGKNTLQYEVPVPPVATHGSRVRFRRRVVLNLAPGEYTFALGLATGSPDIVARVAEMPYPALAEQVPPVVVASHAGSFTITTRRTGQALTHHGLCDLEGDMVCEVLPCDHARERGGQWRHEL
jgi:lipopolysaccharide transport system ATP-binding protein